MPTIPVYCVPSLTAALLQVRSLLSTADVEINLAAGDYYLTSPIVLNTLSAKRLTITGSGQGVTRLLGSVQRPIDRTTKLWRIQSGIARDFHQIYINGQWRTRSLSEDLTPTLRKKLADGAVSLTLPKGAIADTDFNCRLFYRAVHFWREFIIPIASVQKLATGEILLILNIQGAIDAQQGSAAINFKGVFRVEGLRSRLKNGAWIQEGKDIFYQPRPIEGLNNISVCTIPNLTSLIEINQSNVTIQGLTLAEGGTFERLNRCGWNSIQAGGIYSYYGETIDYQEPPSGLLHQIDGDNNRIIDCEMKNSGTAGISILQGRNIEIKGCGISDVGDSGITLSSCDDYLENRRVPVENILVHANAIVRVGRAWAGAPAIQAYMIRDSVFSSNTITDCPYSGICIGWGWGSQTDERLCCNNKILNNTIARVMNYLIDGGAIYTLGNLKGLHIEGNTLTAIGTGHTMPDGRITQIGVYLDEGTVGVTAVYNDVICACPLNINQFVPRAIVWRGNKVPLGSVFQSPGLSGGRVAIGDVEFA
jgi:Right handed beta helix region